MSIQQQVYQAVKARGYVDGWTPEQFAARQVPKLAEELAELSETVQRAYSLDFILRLRLLGEDARTNFDHVRGWHSLTPVIDRARACAELADIVVVALCMAEALGVDVLSAALDKARADVGRGKRNG